MFQYVVVIEIDKDLAERFEEYMRSTHIPDMLATGKFLGASLARTESGSYRMSYFAADRKALERYLAEDTVTMRAQFAEEFPFEFSASREVLEVIDTWDPDQS